MKRVFSSLALCAALVCLPSGAFADDDEQADDGDLFDEFDLLSEEATLLDDEVESASKRRQSIFFSPSAVTVLTRREIRSSGATSLIDLLRRVPGFDVYDMKSAFPLVGARALTETSNNLVLLLVDGREELVELAGFAIWATLTLDLDEIERIEIIRGPGSTLYGANAFAAVVNITTIPETATRRNSVHLAGGELGHHRLFAQTRQYWEVGGGVLRLGLGLGRAGRTTATDPLDGGIQTDYRTHLMLDYQRGDLEVSAQGGAMQANGNMFMVIGDFDATKVSNHWALFRLRVGLSDDLRLKVQAFHNLASGNFHYRTEIRAPGRLDTVLAEVPDFGMESNTFDGKLELDYRPLAALQLIGGGYVRYSTLESAAAIPSSFDELRGGGFIQAQWNPWEPLQLTAGVRLDANSVTAGGPSLSPRVAVVWRLVQHQSVRLGYGLAFRKPSFAENQLHIHVENALSDEVEAKMNASLGNEDLVNEKVHSVEIGWRGHFLDDRLRATADLFYNIYQNMIAFQTETAWIVEDLLPDMENSTFQYMNQTDDVHVLGGELGVAFGPMHDLSAWANLGLRRVMEQGPEPLSSEPLLRFNMGLGWTPPWGLVVDLAVHYVSTYEMPLQDPLEVLETPTPAEVGDAWMAIGRLGYRLEPPGGPALEVGLTVRAPLGAPFREYPGVSTRETGLPIGLTHTTSDFGGELLVRVVAAYLRGTY